MIAFAATITLGKNLKGYLRDKLLNVSESAKKNIFPMDMSPYLDQVAEKPSKYGVYKEKKTKNTIFAEILFFKFFKIYRIQKKIRTPSYLSLIFFLHSILCTVNAV